jgi:hypothetical protein
MGTFIGHVLPGTGFLLIGLWHLFNTITNYAHSPWDFHTRTWFPAKFGAGKLKYLELATIIAGSSLSILAELFIGPERHQPLADDWSIPPEHLNNFDHSSISLFFLIYASVALYAELSKLTVPPGTLHVIAALAFSQELLLFHLHSADHMGAEGHYHWLLQLIVVVTLSATLLEVPFPQSFLVATVRSSSLVFQGVWFIHMGFMLWIPAFIPKGCQMERIEGHDVVKCGNHAATMRAKGLANLQFNWCLAAILVLTVIFYARTVGIYAAKAVYRPLERKPASEGDKKADAAVEMGSHGVERQYFRDGSQSSIDVESLQEAMELER